MNRRLSERARRIRLAIFDVDGVLTDGTVYLSATGEETKAFNIQDGLGLKMLADSGVQTAIISGRKSPIVRLRAKETGIRHVFQGVGDKLAVYRRVLDRLGLKEAESAFMGDDLPDLPVLTRCGFAFSVPAAPEVVRARAHHVTRAGGGRGAVREACELLMQAQGTLDGQVREFLR